MKLFTRNNFLVLLVVVVVVVSIYFATKPQAPKEKEDYSYIQYLEPEDELRTTRELEQTDLRTVENRSDSPFASLGGCPCGALSKFEIPYYMRSAMCKTGMSNTYNGDPGYFLGKTVI